MRHAFPVLALVAACSGGQGQSPSPDARTSFDASPADASPPDAPPPDASPPDAPPVLTDYATLDVAPLVSFVGTWNPTDRTDDAVVPFWNVMRLGAAQRYGVALGGWSYSGFGGSAPDVTPVKVALLEQEADGKLAVATGRYLPSPVTNGEGSILVADFNGDGKDDLFLAAHNESPFLSKASTAYLSRADGTFDQVTLTDSVQAHGADLVRVGGKPTVFVMSFGPASPATNPVYTYDGHGGFLVDGGLGACAGMVVTAGDFLGDGGTEVVYGQLNAGVSWDGNPSQWNFLYRTSGGKLAGAPLALPAPYYEKPQYAAYVSEWDPIVKTHTQRLWVEDLNHDGLPDLIASQLIWSAKVGTQKATLQLLINRGSLQFADATDALDPDLDQDTAKDKSILLADVDGSGINTLFLATPAPCSPSANGCDPVNDKQGNYVLVNDGSGHLHVALHREFVNLGQRAAARLNQLVTTAYWRPDGPTPSFIPYQTAAGKVSFLILDGTDYYDAAAPGTFGLASLPLNLDLATQYRENLIVADRNGSHLIRTFAGDDMIYAGNSGGHCTVDGGAGTDVVVYSRKRADYTVTRTATGWTVTDNVGSEGTDTLRNIEVLRFADGDLR